MDGHAGQARAPLVLGVIYPLITCEAAHSPLFSKCEQGGLSWLVDDPRKLVGQCENQACLAAFFLHSR